MRFVDSEESKKEYKKFLEENERCNFQQSLEWAEVKKPNWKPEVILAENEDGNIILNGGEFGWGWDKFNDPLTKANYCAVDNQYNINRIEFLKDVIKEQTGANEVIIDISDNYKADNLKSLSIRELYLVNEKYAKNLINLKKTMEKRKEKC